LLSDRSTGAVLGSRNRIPRGALGRAALLAAQR
jgi:hypothetical protein